MEQQNAFSGGQTPSSPQGYKSRDIQILGRGAPLHSRVVSDFVLPAKPLQPKVHKLPSPVSEPTLAAQTQLDPQSLSFLDNQPQTEELIPAGFANVPVDLNAPAGPKQRRAFRPKLAASVAVIILTLVSGAWFGKARLDSQGAKQTLSASASTATPGASTVDSYVSSTAVVAPNDPARLIIEPASLSVPITSIGDQIAVPKKLSHVGWYQSSGTINSPGKAVVLTGSTGEDGAFKSLNTLQIGDTIKVELGNKTAADYEVVATRVYPAGGLDKTRAMTPFEASEGVNLVAFEPSNDSNILVVFTAKSVL